MVIIVLKQSIKISELIPENHRKICNELDRNSCLVSLIEIIFVKTRRGVGRGFRGEGH